jgi:hypothetical protein
MSSRQVIIRGKQVTQKGLTCESDEDGNVTVTGPGNPVGLLFSEEEAIRLSENLSDLIEWKSDASHPI